MDNATHYAVAAFSVVSAVAPAPAAAALRLRQAVM